MGKAIISQSIAGSALQYKYEAIFLNIAYSLGLLFQRTYAETIANSKRRAS